MSRSGKIALWAAGRLAVVVIVFLIAIAVGQGLGQASVWATVLGLPIGLIGAIAGVLALVIRPASGQPGADPTPARDRPPGPRVAGPGTLVRLAATGVRGQSLDAWALLRDGTVRRWWWPQEDGSPGWSPPEIFRALPEEGGPITDLAASSRGPGHAEVFAVDRHGTLWHRWWLQGEGWANWQEFTAEVSGRWRRAASLTATSRSWSLTTTAGRSGTASAPRPAPGIPGPPWMGSADPGQRR